MDNDAITVKIDILQRPYTVKVLRQDEDIFRKAGVSIEESIQRYAAKGTLYRDNQDLLAMALLESTVVALKNRRKTDGQTDAYEILDRLKSIDGYISANIERNIG
ncbi:MAG: cell division protein ZapA [Bacteroidales bacterium]|nr:cell division protein ZapA [Bacteroidales bacterium]